MQPATATSDGPAIIRVPGAEPLPTLAYTIDETCAIARIRRDLFYRELKQGRGPKTFKIGKRRLVRHEALVGWLAELEQQNAPRAA